MIHTFELNVNGTVYKDKEITETLIRNSLEQLTTDMNSFVVLQPEKPINQSIYIQAANNFLVEIRFVLKNGKFYHYAYTTSDKEEVATIFLDYWQQNKIPAIDHWENISKRLRPSLFSRFVHKCRQLFKKRNS